jgi:hypothetical protein
MVIFRRVFAVVILCAMTAMLHAQTSPSGKPQDVFHLLYAPRDKTIEVVGGITLPLSHAGLTDFWLRGPSLGATFLVRANYNIKFGVGGEAALFSFRRGAFALAYPGIVTQARNLATVYLYIAVRNYLKPSVRMTPFIGAEIGVLRTTGAEYKDFVAGVRNTYYEIPGMSHLASSVSAGVDYYIFRRTALQIHGRALYVFNDPNTGLLFTVHAGVKIAL